MDVEPNAPVLGFQYAGYTSRHTKLQPIRYTTEMRLFWKPTVMLVSVNGIQHIHKVRIDITDSNYSRIRVNPRHSFILRELLNHDPLENARYRRGDKNEAIPVDDPVTLTHEDFCHNSDDVVPFALQVYYDPAAKKRVGTITVTVLNAAGQVVASKVEPFMVQTPGHGPSSKLVFRDGR